MHVDFESIGVIHSPYKTTSEIPRQSIYSKDKQAVLELSEALTEGLAGYEPGDYMMVFFYFHQSKNYKLKQIPGKNHAFKQPGKERGVFAIRSPHRPNGIGLSIVKILKIEKNRITFEGVDMLDETPVLDIKPYLENLNPESGSIE